MSLLLTEMIDAQNNLWNFVILIIQYNVMMLN